jgi:heat shock protein HtpX
MDRYALSNSLKTAVLLGGIGGLLVAVGMAFGGSSGAILGLALGFVVCGVSYWKSDTLAIKSSGAVPVSEAEAPNLYGAMRALCAAAELPMPRLYVIHEAQPNAFATGRNPQNAAVAVTTGLLEMCTRDELIGVLAHELSHVRHRDILIGSVAAAVATGISFVANMAMWFGMFGGRDDDRPGPFATLAIAIVAPVAAGLLQMALSRSREFEADRGAAELTGDPEALARALLKLESSAQRIPAPVAPSQASAYIVNPLSGQRASISRLFTTHPPIEDRVARLRAMAGSN